MARVDHVNVVTVFDAGVHDGRVFIAMQLVRGDSLRRHLATPRSATERIAIFRDAARGLAAAHSANVVHRDFKPENVLVGADAVRVTDFGLARPAQATGASRSPELGPLSTDFRWGNEAETQGLSGTPAYLSPEQIDGGVVGPKSDQFSLGVALHEALYGRHPFGLGTPQGPATLRELRARMDRGPLSPTASSDVPAWVGPIADRLLAVDPAQRFASMDDVAARLAGPDQRFERLAGRLLAAILGTMVLHVSLFVLVVGCIFLPEATDAPDWSYPVELYAGYVFLVWGALGAFAAPVAAFGLARRRRWAYLYCFVYAVASLPTVLGTPLAIIAFHVLSRAEVKGAFGRVSRPSPRAAALARG